MTMRALVCLALTALWAGPALAQSSAQPVPPDPEQSRLPLAAMRHQQPRREAVDTRERSQLGPDEARALQRERAEEDQLYNDVMRNSAPPAGAH
jgi:hypothetical protein